MPTLYPEVCGECRRCPGWSTALRADGLHDMVIQGWLMPKELEEKLKKEAAQKGLSKERAGAYVYGTLRKAGWRPKPRKNRRKG